MLRSSVLAVCVSVLGGVSAQDSPPELTVAYADDFRANTTPAYTVRGEVTWKSGRLVLSPAASLERKHPPSPWVKITLSLMDSAGDETPPAEMRITLDLDDAYDCAVRLRRVRRDEDWSTEISLVNLTKQDGRTVEEVVRDPITVEGQLETVSVEYRNGLTQVSVANTSWRAYLDNGTAPVTAFRVSAEETRVALDSLSVASSGGGAAPTEQLQAQLAEIEKIDNELFECFDQGRFKEAAVLAEKVLTLTEASLGRWHPDYAASLNNLAVAYQSSGDYRRAESVYLEARKTQEAFLGPWHPHFATSLNNLGGLWERMGFYDRAEPLYEQALQIYLSVFGEEDHHVGLAVNNLAGLFDATGDYARAESLYVRALKLAEAQGPRHPEYATTLNNLAMHYEGIGDYARAVPLCAQALEIREEVLGEDHPEYAGSVNSLGGLYAMMGDHERAEPLYKRAVEIKRKTLGKQHPLYALSVNNLAEVYLEMGDFRRAGTLHEEAMRVRKDALGNQHPDYAASLNNMGGVLEALGEYDEAERHYQEAVDVLGKALGEQAVPYAVSLTNLAGLYYMRGENERAEPLFARGSDVIRRHLDRVSISQSERQQKRNQARQRFFLDERLANALQTRTDGHRVLESVWRWKGAVTARQRTYRTVAATPTLAPLFNELRGVSRQLSGLAARAPLAPPESAGGRQNTRFQAALERWQQRLESLTKRREELEKQIATGSDEFSKLIEPLSVDRVRSSLPDGTALVDFLDYDHPTPDENAKGGLLWERRYVAFIVRKDSEPVVVGLGSVAALSDAITAFRRPFANELADAAMATRAAAELRRDLWRPLEKHLNGIHTVVLSPDTVLGTLPFAAIPGRTPGTFLLEDYRLVTLSFTNLLPQLRDADTPLKSGMLLVGDVAYDDASGATGPSTAPAGQSLAALAGEQARLSRTRGGRGKRWQSLAGFNDELTLIRSLFEGRDANDARFAMLRGRSATEQSFLRQADDFRTLHLITHGFFEDADVESLDRVPSFARSSDSEKAGAVMNRWLPGLLSGLVLAGANSPPVSPDDLNDGILRASEIEASSLSGVDLVVLSACETGLGAVAGGEGLTGLQRAFHVAGARSVVASLWKVDDRATQELMKQFYTNLWLRQQSKVDALRNAQLWILNNRSRLAAVGVENPGTRGEPRVRNSAAAGANGPGRTSPFFWAAFTLSGDWQ